jgi:hypothetical protein
VPSRSKKPLRATFPSRRPRRSKRLPKRRPSRAAILGGRGAQLRPEAPEVRPQARCLGSWPGRTRPAAVLWLGRSSSPACCSTTAACAITKVARSGLLNDSKQVTPERREVLFRALVACASRSSST